MHPAILLLALTLARVCPAVATSTCRPVNYILDRLPQQCPTSSAPFPSDLTPKTGIVETIVQSHPVVASPDAASPSAASSFAKPSTEISSPSILSSSPRTPGPTDIAFAIRAETPDTPPAHEGFLSFEEWKRINLQSAHESGDLSSSQPREAPHPRDRPKDQAIDSLGGDEIDAHASSPSNYGKTSKERFNYASFDCAAGVLKANPEARGSSSILNENRDRYMLNKCAAPAKFVIVEMCEDILVDTVVLANFEFFSSTFKEVRVSVTDRYPVAERGWRVLGTFLGRNTREIQVFAVNNPLIWARYLRLEFLSHYGNEFYCPLTLLRIHGTTMMEEYKNQEKQQEEYRQEKIVVKVENMVDPLVSNFTSDSENAGSAKVSSKATDPAAAGSYFGSPKPKKRKDASASSDTLSATESFRNGRKTLAMNSSIEFGSNHSNNVCTNATNLDTNSTLAIPELTSSAETKITESTSNTIIHDKPEVTTSISPTTQESVYKQITKRLSLLEANATLSLRYIEEQSQLLRDVFSKMERRHTQKLDSFLAELNSTLISRMQYFRQQYEQLWQSTIVELESQKESSREEIIAMSASLSLLADELIFQKRMSIAHSVILLVTLLFILTTRGVRLDLHRINGPLHQDPVSPVQSPQHPSCSFLHRTPVSEPCRTPDRDGGRLFKTGFQHLSPELEKTARRMRASPPIDLVQQWRSATPSNLHRFLAVGESDSEGDETGTEEGELFPVDVMPVDYPTPGQSQDICD